jgi:hypothetical protein
VSVVLLDFSQDNTSALVVVVSVLLRPDRGSASRTTENKMHAASSTLLTERYLVVAHLQRHHAHSMLADTYTNTVVNRANL